MGLTRDSKGRYKLTGKTTEQDVLAAAEGILKAKLERQGSIGNPSDAADSLRSASVHCFMKSFTSSGSTTGIAS